MNEILRRTGSVRNPHTKIDHFDKIAVRLTKRLTKPQIEKLAKHSRSVDQRFGRYIKGNKTPILLTVVRPDKDALASIAKLEGAFVNYVEVARDIVLECQADARRLSDLAFKTFVQPRHGRRTTKVVGNGWYTGPNKHGHRFVGYGDRASKFSKRIPMPCFHFECRAHGVAAVRRILDVHQLRDLVSFAHQPFWQKHLSFYTVDLERLGRFHENKRTGERRKTSPVIVRGEFKYNSDRAKGGILFKLHSGDFKTVQQFVDGYGMGPYMRRITPHPLLSTTSPHVSDTTQSSKHLDGQAKPNHKPKSRQKG